MTKNEWLKQSLNLLSIHGIDILKIDSLCKKINLTKGSFYHHFKNYEIFINALLDYWYETYTVEILNEIEKYEDNVIQQIEVINEMMYSKDLNIEVQLRVLGFQNKVVQNYIEKTDLHRLEAMKAIQKKLSPTSTQKDIDLMVSCIYSQFIGSLFILPKIPNEKLKQMDNLFLDLCLKVNY